MENNKTELKSYQVRPITDYLPEYKDKHRIIVKAVESRTDLSIEERIKLYDLELGKLKNIFVQLRKNEYESKSIELSVSHSCTSSSSGGKKDCGWKCIDAPTDGLYTKQEWVRVVGTNKGLSIKETQACLRMTVSGSGRNSGTLFAIFKYKPDFISSTVEKDTITLFNLIISTKDLTDYIDERVGNYIEINDQGKHIIYNNQDED